MHPPTTVRPHWALLLAVFTVAMAALGLEVSLTRAFSVLLRFHFVFLAISLATCGLGLGGLLDFGLRKTVLRRAAPVAILVVCGSLAAALTPLAFVLLFATPLSAQLTSMWVVTAICLPPFLAAGAFLSHAFAWHSREGGNLYSADLVGAALGSFLVIGALQLLGGINAGMVWGAVVGLGAFVLAVTQGRIRLAAVPAAVTLATLALVFCNRGGALINLPVMPLSNDPSAKPLYQELGDPRVGAKIVDTEWNAFARTDVVSNKGTDDLFVYTDGEVPTNMIKFDGNLRKIMDRLTAFIGFVAFYEQRPDSALLIGPGGGLDVLLALAVGTRKIDGVEVNPSIPRLVRKYSDFTGHIYDIEGVKLRVDEGRSFVSRSRERYDLIYMALTKTATTTSSSLALVESYIHTVEAFDEFLSHLTDRGAIAFVCQNPLVLMRTMLTAVAALEHRGTPRREAFKQVYMVSVPRMLMGVGPYRYMLVVTARPVTAARSRQLATNTIAMGLDPVFFPTVFEPAPFPLLTQKGLSDDEFVARWNQWQGAPDDRRVDFSPCTDDRPFVVDMSVGVPAQLVRFLWVAIGLMVVLTAGVIVGTSRRRAAGVPGAVTLTGAALYFCLLGIGFMLVEVVLTQRLVLYLGYPVLTLSVILFSLLLGGGLGSLWSQSWPEGRGLVLRAAGAAFVVALGALAVSWLHPLIVHATLACDIRLRCAVAMAMLIPLGFVMGTPFPTGIRIVGGWARDLVPWMWGLNGVTSVVGSVSAMALAKLFGFGSVLVVGTIIYALAAIVALIHHLLFPESSLGRALPE